MTLYFAEATTGAITAFPHADGTGIYTADLPPGTYTAYAYAEGYEIGGSYSQAVLCGLSVDCADHSLVPFDVAAGSPTDGINICDWYGGPGTVPKPPGAASAAPISPTPVPPPGRASTCRGPLPVTGSCSRNRSTCMVSPTAAPAIDNTCNTPGTGRPSTRSGRPSIPPNPAPRRRGAPPAGRLSPH